MRIALRIFLITGMISFACIATGIYLQRMDRAFGTPMFSGFGPFESTEGIGFGTIGMLSGFVTLAGITVLGLVKLVQRIVRRA